MYSYTSTILSACCATVLCMYIELLAYFISARSFICAVNIYTTHAYLSNTPLSINVASSLTSSSCYRSRISDVASEARADRFYHTSSVILRSAYRYGRVRYCTINHLIRYNTLYDILEATLNTIYNILLYIYFHLISYTSSFSTSLPPTSRFRTAIMSRVKCSKLAKLFSNVYTYYLKSK